ncbi:MAG: outer membrane protein assembly factor BamB [Actinomycetota bacterium]|jgi:outer membrane protein assembly factor BamB|nr:outer membrane protein assembly factor BamB [Actinomycetota bacterium]
MTLGRRPFRFRLLGLAGALALVLAGCGRADGPRRPDPAAGPASDRGTAGPGSTAATDRAIDVEEVWRWPAPPPGNVGMPAADGKGVAATYGHLGVVLLGLDGTRRWELERLGLRDVAPALTADLVVAATEEGVLAVDRASGRLRWDTPLGERANTPVIAGGLAVVSTWEGSLIALDLADGHVVWRTALPGPALGPAATDGTAVAVTWESTPGDAAGAVVVDAADGRQRWSVPLEPGGVGGPAIVALPAESTSVVVAVAGDIAAHALDLADGSERWRAEAEGKGSPEVPPLPLGGEVLVAHRLAGLMLLDAGTGAEQWIGSADGAAVRGGPAGLGPDGPFAFAIDDGRLFLVGPGLEPRLLDWPGRVSGVAMTADGRVLVGTREAGANYLIALDIAPA